MFRKFMKEEKGSVVQWIILLAVIALLVVGTSSKTKFYTKYWSDSSHENTDEGLTGDGVPSTPTTSGESTIKPYVTGGVAGFHSGLYKRIGSTQTRIADLKSISWEPNKYVHYKIRVEHNDITIWKDGSKIVDYTDETNPILKGAWDHFLLAKLMRTLKIFHFKR